MQMARRELTFRVFVSSTFSDLKEERNALQRRMFPGLRELCRQHGCRFQAIDLRWGVREEAARDQQTMNICLQELERCQFVTPRPNFVLLLGDRYGWRPLPPQVEAQEFEEILEKVSPEDKNFLLWDERQPDGGKGWYRKDENAVPAEYCLQPREVIVPDGATEEEKQEALEREARQWEQIEGELTKIILQAIDRLGWSSDDPRRIKYEASATHQEILHGALRVPDAKEHVYCFFREIKGLPQGAAAGNFIDRDEKAPERLENLKKSLSKYLPGNIFKYEARWTGSGITTDHLDKLCQKVYDSLSRIILEEIAQLKEAKPLDKELADHDAFCEERARFFTGRTAILKSIGDYLKGKDNHPLAVFGEPGSGKSAVMARAIQLAREAFPDAAIIYRFIGATPSSSDGRSLLESLYHQIYEAFHFEEQKLEKLAAISETGEEAQKTRQRLEEEYSIPTDFQKLSMTFRDFLVKIPASRKFILFLDALDQLSDADRARSLTWLPSELPGNVRLVVSSLPGECLSALERKLPPQDLVKLEPMSPEEGGRLLDLWLENAGRTLQPRQRDEVLGKFGQSGLPLYLKLAFEEARRWKSYTERVELSPDIPSIIGDLFARLSSDANHGRIMVSRSLGYLAAAKNGLSEDELLDVLSGDEELFQDFMKRARHKLPEEEDEKTVKRLPVIIWSRLYYDLKPYLTERTADGASLMTFYHPATFGRAVIAEYLAGDAKRERHRGLARYFGSQKLYAKEEDKKTVNLRKVSELPYQQTHGEMWSEIEQTLCDLHFIAAKCAAGMTYDLVGDYNRALDALPEAQPEKEGKLKHEARVKKYTEDLIAYAKGEIDHLDIIPSVEPWSEEKIRRDTERIIKNPTCLDRIQAFSQFVSSESHALVKFAAHHGFVVQQAYNSASSGPVVSAAEAIINAGVSEVLLLRLPAQRPDYNPRPALLTTLEGHTEWVTAVALTVDGRRAVSGSYDYTLRVWDLERGRCLDTLEGHGSVVESVVITPDGRKAVSGSWDETVRVWDLETSQCLRILKGHKSSVNNVAVTPDGKRAVSGSEDKTLKVWDLETGRCLRTLKGYTNNVAITPDGRRVVSVNWDKTLSMWDLETGRCLRTFKRHKSWVTTMADIKRAVSISKDNTLRVWDLETGQCLRTLKSHPAPLTKVALTPDSRRAVTGSHNILRVWDLETGCCLSILEGHTDWVNSVALTPDGRRAVSGSYDNTLMVWDLERGRCLSTVERHTASVEGVAVTHDGRRAVSGSCDNTLKVWDMETGCCLRTLKGHRGRVSSVVLTPDDRRVVSKSGDLTLKVWDMETGRCLKTLKGHKDRVDSMALTPDGRRVVSGSSDDTLKLWDLEKAHCISTLKEHRSYLRVTMVALTPDGRKGVSKSGDLILKVWDLETSLCLRTLEGHTGYVFSVGIIPDGRRAVSGSEDGTLRVWDLEKARCLSILKGDRELVGKLAITSDGRRVVSESQDYTLEVRDTGFQREVRRGLTDPILQVWDLVKGRCLSTLEGHTESVNGLAVTPDGREAVSGSDDNTLRVWDVESGECIAIYHAGSIVGALSDIRADGRFAFGTDSGEVIFVNPRNLPVGTPLVTPLRLWLYGQKTRWLFRRKRANGYWDDSITAVCPWCGKRFPVSNKILDVITGIARSANLSPKQSPCLELPAEAWDEPRLLSECPLCHKPLKFNPFIVDNRERY